MEDVSSTCGEGKAGWLFPLLSNLMLSLYPPSSDLLIKLSEAKIISRFPKMLNYFINLLEAL